MQPERGNRLSSAGRSETGVSAECGWDVKRGNSLGEAPGKEQDKIAGRVWKLPNPNLKTSQANATDH